MSNINYLTKPTLVLNLNASAIDRIQCESNIVRLLNRINNTSAGIALHQVTRILTANSPDEPGPHYRNFMTLAANYTSIYLLQTPGTTTFAQYFDYHNGISQLSNDIFASDVATIASANQLLDRLIACLDPPEMCQVVNKNKNSQRPGNLGVSGPNGGLQPQTSIPVRKSSFGNNFVYLSTHN